MPELDNTYNLGIDAPIAKIEPKVETYHDIEKIDNYAWLRADNWEQVLQNPTQLSSEIRNHLEAENNYQDAFMKDTEILQEELFVELKGRIKEDDSSVPIKDGQYSYGISYEKGAGLPCFFRIKDGVKTIYLNGDEEKNKCSENAYFQIGSVTHSPDHNKFVFTYDNKGSEYYTAKIRSFSSTTEYNDEIISTNGNIAWNKDSTGFFYVKLDDQHRPHEVYYHIIGQNQAEDTLIYRENDSGYFMSIHNSRDKKYILISIHNHETSETWIIDQAHNDLKPICIRKRETGLEYHISSGDGEFFILTNRDGATDFKIMKASIEQLLNDNWQEYVPHTAGKLIISHCALENYLVWVESENGLINITYMDRGDNSSNIKKIQFFEEVYDLDFIPGYEYNTQFIRFSYSSPTTPRQTYDYNLKTQDRTLIKEQLIPSGHDSSQYIAQRVMAPAHDGELIPISLYYHKDTKLDGTAPCFLYGYGAYGISIPADFNSNSISLVNRGFIYAIAHIRGGKEKGTEWYNNGKYKMKTNSFKDYISAARYLVKQKYTNHNKLIAYGGSAGGMLMGSVANMAPNDFLSVIAIVPFVDVLNTMLDSTLPLTPPEWPEWGNPLKSKEDYELISSYSPYDNIQKQNYPYILAITGLTDPRVTYWEAAKWIAKLREIKTDQKPALLKINMDSGHAGSSDRFSKLKEVAYVYAYILKLLNIK